MAKYLLRNALNTKFISSRKRPHTSNASSINILVALPAAISDNTQQPSLNFKN
ncbi:unnamed protein product, partial [Dovyalis caffra]